MKRPSPDTLAHELDWMFMYVDPNPIFMFSAQIIRELAIENERLRNEKGFTPPDRDLSKANVWG